MIPLINAALSELASYLNENARLTDRLTESLKELKLYKHYNPYKHGKIYCVSNSVDDMIYVGCTYQSLAERWREHKRAYKRGSSLFYRHMQALGRNKFKIQLIKLAPTISRWHLENAEYAEQIKISHNNRLFVPHARQPYGWSVDQKRSHRRRNRRLSKRREYGLAQLQKSSSSEEGRVRVKGISKIPKRRLEQRSIRSYFSA